MENNDTNLKLANVIFDLAKNSEESGKYEDAIKSYKEVLNVFEQALGAEDEQTKEVYTNIGMCYKALGKNEEALTYLTKALSSSNTTSEVQKQETAIAKQEINEEESEEAYRLHLEAIRLKGEGITCQYKKNYNEAINYYEDAVKILKKVLGNNHVEIGAGYRDIGECYYYFDKIDEAINYYKDALKIFDQSFDFDNVYSADLYHKIGVCYSEINKVEIALYYLRKALRIFKMNNDEYEEEGVIETINEIKEKFYGNSLVEYEEEDEYDEEDCEYDEEDEYDEEYSVEKAPKISELSDYGDNYSDSGFWNKVKKLGKKVLKPALQLYYVMKESSTPLDTKGLIIGALGYLILPIDLIPDFIPVAGYTDDLAALLAVVKMCKEHITPEIERKVRKDLGE
ncbi:MAG: tetratricopeptide repeat protein [Bacteroidales bacterium]|nr:tetratricopeptide repeat protein [Bacteroidales bacterium]